MAPFYVDLNGQKAMKITNSLSIVIPMYKEADNVAPMLEAVHQGLESYAGP